MEIREIHSGDLGSRGRACRRKGKRQDQAGYQPRKVPTLLSQPSARGSTGRTNFPSVQGGFTVVHPCPSPVSQEKVEPQTGAGLQ